MSLSTKPLTVLRVSRQNQQEHSSLTSTSSSSSNSASISHPIQGETSHGEHVTVSPGRSNFKRSGDDIVWMIAPEGSRGRGKQCSIGCRKSQVTTPQASRSAVSRVLLTIHAHPSTHACSTGNFSRASNGPCESEGAAPARTPRHRGCQGPCANPRPHRRRIALQWYLPRFRHLLHEEQHM